MKQNDPTKSEAVLMLEGLRRGTAQRTEFTWPGTEKQFLMSALSCDDVQAAQSAATKRWQELKLEVNLYTADDFNSELLVQLLARAIRRVDRPELQAFPKVEDLRALITPDERIMLTSIYLDNQEQGNPELKDVSEETIALIEQTVKKKDLATLTSFGSSTLAIYLLGTASQRES